MPGNPHTDTPSHDRPTDQLPPVWNIRRYQNRDFTNRNDELDRLRSLLKSDKIVVLADGPGGWNGLGKTELALEFAYRHSKDYQVIWWVDALTPAVLKTRYGQLEDALLLLGGSQDNSLPALENVRQRLGKSSGWLLILDDVERFDLLRTILPRRPAGHVVVVSRSEVTSDERATLTLHPFSEADAAAFLGLEPSGECAQQLYRSLQGVPLLLHLLRSYTQVSGKSLEECARQLPSNDFAKKHPDEPGAAVTPLCRILLSMGMEYLTKNDRVARDLFALLAFLAPNGVPIDVLAYGEGHLSRRLSETVADNASLRERIGSLHKLGLVRLEDDNIFVHPLLQEVTRDGMGEQPRKAWATAAVRTMASAFPKNHEYTQPSPVITRILPHLLTAVRHAQQMKICREDTSSLLYLTGLYLHGCRLYEEASRAYEQSIELAKALYGENHPTIAVRTNSLGVAQQEIGNYHRAEECYEKAIEICDVVYGPTEEAVYAVHDESMLTMPMRNLCTVIGAMGDVEAAQRAYQRAMKVFLEVYEWNHPMVAECANAFGVTWLQLRNYTKARNCFEKAVKAEENAEKPVTGNLAQYLNNLGNVLVKIGDAPTAHEQFERALRLDKLDFGNDDIRVGHDLANVAHTYNLQRQYAEATRCYRDAIELYEREYGADSADLTTLLNHLGFVHLAANEADDAQQCFERALAIDEKLHGEESRELIRDLLNVSRAQQDRKLFAKARDTLDRALNIAVSTDGAHSELYATVLYRIGKLLHRQGELDEAMQHLKEAMSIDQVACGKKHPNLARDAYAIGCLLVDRKETVVAMGHLSLALDVFETSLGKEHAKTRRARAKLDELSA